MEQQSVLLAQRAMRGDREAFAELYSLYAADLYHFACYYMGNSHDAQDAVQSAVLTAFRSMASLQKCEAFRSWLFTILANCCKDMLRLRSRHDKETLPEDAEIPSPEDASQWDEAVTLHSLLALLPEKDRRILLLEFVGGYSAPEIGKLLHMKPGAVRTRRSRAMAKLRRTMPRSVGKGEIHEEATEE